MTEKKFQLVLLTIIIVTLSVTFTVSLLSCAPKIPVDRAKDINTRTVTLFKKHVEFLRGLDLTPTQRLQIEIDIHDAENIYRDVVLLYGEASNQAIDWREVIAALTKLASASN